MNRGVVGLACGILTLFVAGCGNAGAKVEGTVNHKGMPIVDGSISFEPANGAGRPFGAVIKDGKFETLMPGDLTGGEMIVRVRSITKTGKQIPTEPKIDGKYTMVDEVISLPPQFNDKSTLKETIEPGKDNHLTISLM